MLNKEYICQNRKARFDYEILETIEAGIVLTGSEIKSIRLRNVSLDAAYADISDNQVNLINCNIEPYKQASMYNHNPKRSRILLLHRSEIKNFAEKSQIKGHTLIPLSLYLLNGRAKIELAVCKGKKNYDKRNSIKNREAKLDIRVFS